MNFSKLVKNPFSILWTFIYIWRCGVVEVKVYFEFQNTNQTVAHSGESKSGTETTAFLAWLCFSCHVLLAWFHCGKQKYSKWHSLLRFGYISPVSEVHVEELKES